MFRFRFGAPRADVDQFTDISRSAWALFLLLLVGIFLFSGVTFVNLMGIAPISELPLRFYLLTPKWRYISDRRAEGPKKTNRAIKSSAKVFLIEMFSQYLLERLKNICAPIKNKIKNYRISWVDLLTRRSHGRCINMYVLALMCLVQRTITQMTPNDCSCMNGKGFLVKAFFVCKRQF